MRNQKFTIFFLFLSSSFFILSSCSSPGFIEDSYLQSLSAPKDAPAVLLAERVYKIESRTRVIEKNHLILVMGSPQASNRWLIQQNNPVARLTEFNIRLIRNGKEIKNESKKELYSFAESGYRSISEQRYLIPSLINEVQPGDWVELISESENDLIGLGLTFSLDEFPDVSQNLSVEFISPGPLTFSVFVKNDTTRVQTEIKDGLTSRKLFWPGKRKKTPGSLEAKRNQPQVFAIPGLTDETWNGFASFYQHLIKDRTEEFLTVKPLADSLTAGLTDPVEKMKVLFNYCQTRFRYEQVYLTRGEFIPNPLSDILKHKYADCKDYSLLIWSLARSVGIHTRLALVMRDRGVPFFDDVPASQFNHLIVEWTTNGTTYWFDGTNRISIPGLPGDDLINQKALVMDGKSSEIKVIQESRTNRVDITGNFVQNSKNLKGTLEFSLQGEFALTINYLGIFLNEFDFRKFLQHWVTEQTNQEVTLSDLSWDLKPDLAKVTCKIQVPNSVTLLNGKKITSLNRIFSGLAPYKQGDLNQETVYYFPAFNRGKIDLTFLSSDGETTRHSYDFELPAGPFYSPGEKVTFISGAGEHLKKLSQPITL